MTKSDFLNKLREKIKVLNNDEITDIINEYSNHFDEKKVNGKSDEEIIKSFGDIDELAKEILSAYKVSSNDSNTVEGKINSVVNFISSKVKNGFDNITKNKNIDTLDLIYTILSVILIIFLLRIPTEIIYWLGIFVINTIFISTISTLLVVLWTIFTNCLFIICAIYIIYVKSKDFKNKVNKDTYSKEKVISTPRNNKDTNNTKTIKQKDNNVMLNIISLLISFPLIIVAITFVIIASIILGLMLKGIYFFGLLLIFVGLSVVMFTIIAGILNMGGKK